MTFEAIHISQSIACTPDKVSAYAGAPENLPNWALGVSAGIRKEGERWITDSPMGEVEIRFTGPIESGVLDHEVILPDGTTFHNPLRVLKNGDGSEVVLTFYRLPGMTDQDVERDSSLIKDDLLRLRDLLESN